MEGPQGSDEHIASERNRKTKDAQKKEDPLEDLM